MSWLPPHVGAPPPLSPATPSTPSGPISSATVNVYLKPVAAAESAAEAKTAEAEALAAHATQAHDGYEAAFSKIQTAVGAWRSVQKLAEQLLAADDQQPSPDKTAAMHQAKVAAPGIVASAHAALQHLVALRSALKADQAAKRPDLPGPSEPDPYAESGIGWPGLAIGLGIVYLLWKAVF